MFIGIGAVGSAVCIFGLSFLFVATGSLYSGVLQGTSHGGSIYICTCMSTMYYNTALVVYTI